MSQQLTRYILSYNETHIMLEFVDEGTGDKEAYIFEPSELEKLSDAIIVTMMEQREAF